MKNNKFNIDYEDSQQTFSIQEDQVKQDCYNMFKYILDRADIIELSALKGQNLNSINLNFDLMICDNEQIHAINKEYRGKDNPTDVITFALFADSPDNQIICDNEIHLGQVIISADKADEQAKNNRITFNQEFLFLLSHGILHLLGFDHPDEESLESMLNLQDEMISNV